MRKHRHLPQFTKRHFVEADAVLHIGRRAHGIAKHVAPTPSALVRAEKRRYLYMHSAAMRRDPIAMRHYNADLTEMLGHAP